MLEPDLARVAHWTARGLTAYDAAYVAVAEANNVALVTDDDLIVATAGEIATALASTGNETPTRVAYSVMGAPGIEPGTSRV